MPATWNPFPVETMPVPVPVHRFSVKQYHEMIRTGILGENDRVELLAGVIVDKMPQYPAHSGSLTVLRRELAAVLSDDWVVRVQCPITLPDSEPEPDLAVVPGPEERYFGEHPGPADVTIVIEVADSSLEEDRGRKQALYAAAKIPLYWIVNLVEHKVEVYTAPRGGKSPRYRQRDDFGIEFGAPVFVAGRRVGGIPVHRLFDTGSFFER